MDTLPDENWGVKRLIEALKGDDSGTRMWAAMSLGDLGDDQAVIPLICALEEDENEDVRQFAAFALGKIEDERAIIPLLRALNDDEDDVSMGAAKAIMKFSDRDKIKENVKKLLFEIQSDSKSKIKISDAIACQPALQQIFKEAGKEKLIENRVFVAVPSKNIEESIRKVLVQYNLEAVILENISIGNIFESVQSCGYGIADISNPNSSVLYELGVMHALSKRCVVFKFENDEQPLDISGIEYLGYKSLQELEEKLSEWISKILWQKDK